MERFTVDLSKTSLEEFFDNNIIEKGDVIEIVNIKNFWGITVEEQFFKDNEPSNLEEDDILETFDEEIVDKIAIKFENFFTFDETPIANYATTFYGKATIFNGDVESKLKGLFFYYI